MDNLSLKKEILVAVLGVVISKITGTVLTFFVISFFSWEYTRLPWALMILSVMNVLLVALALTYFFKLNGVRFGGLLGLMGVVLNIVISIAVWRQGYLLKNLDELWTPFNLVWIGSIIKGSTLMVLAAMVGGLMGDKLTGRKEKEKQTEK